MRELAERAGLSHTHIVRMENGERGLSVHNATKIASALGQPVADVLGVADGSRIAGPAGGLAEEAEAFDVAGDESIVVRPKAGDNVMTYRIRSSAVESAGIRDGDIVFVDISQAAVDGIKPLQCVIAQVYDRSGGPMGSATTVVRQFVPPSLLITNRPGRNEVMNIETDDVAIKGVIVGTFSRLRI